jgi:hypothetical protein
MIIALYRIRAAAIKRYKKEGHMQSLVKYDPGFHAPSDPPCGPSIYLFPLQIGRMQYKKPSAIILA